MAVGWLDNGAIGPVLPPHPQSDRRTRSSQGDLAQVACLVYRMLKYGQEYVTQSMEEYEAKVKANMLKALKRKAAAMGFELSPLPTQ